MPSLASAKFRTYRLVELIFDYPSDYNGLNDSEKIGLALIISCGKIDMQDGSVIRNKIFDMFPSGDIHDELAAMLLYIPSEPP